MTLARVEVGRWDGERPRRRDVPEGPATPLQGLEDLAWLLDSSIPVPGTRFRVGLDSVLGLVPVLGDAVGALLSAYLLWLGARMGVSRPTLLRMALNVALESAVGVIPFLGDVFDMAWKANRRNVDLLASHLRDPERARRRDTAFAVLLIALLLAVLALMGWAALALGRWAWGALRG